MPDTFVSQLMLFIVALAIILPLTWRLMVSLINRLGKALEERDKALLDKIASREAQYALQRQVDSLDAKVVALEASEKARVETITAQVATIEALSQRIVDLETTIEELRATIVKLTQERGTGEVSS